MRMEQLEKQLEGAKETLFVLFEQNPKLRVSVDGNTVYLTRMYAARLREGTERARAAEILGAWVPELVKPDFNLNSVSAYVRESMENAGGEEVFRAEIPAAVNDVIEIRDWWDIRAIKS